MTNPIDFKEDLVEAKKRFDQGLKELGYTKDTFPPLVISYSQQANRKQFADYLQHSWSSAFGIKIELKYLDWTTYLSNLMTGQYDVSFGYKAPFYNDPAEVLNYYSSMGMANYSKWTHPLYTEKLTNAIQSKEFQKRMKLLEEAELVMLEQMPLIPICTDKIMFAKNPNLKGLVFDCIGALDLSYASFKK
jgi:oligopeptide transport system substrate-binding protein